MPDSVENVFLSHSFDHNQNTVLRILHISRGGNIPCVLFMVYPQNQKRSNI